MLKVNEIFGPTIQGEGNSVGKEVMFIRLSGCNLACIWCDTPYTWNWTGTKFKHPVKVDRSKEEHQMTIEQVIGRLKEFDVKALVISGGEPLLQQLPIIQLVRKLKKDGYWVEVETNGTQEPLDELLELVDQINCSPKLANSGEDNRPAMRQRPASLEKLVSSPKVYFKFVIQSRQDIREVKKLVHRYQMKQVYLMPEGRTKEEQLERQQEVEDLAKELGFQFSPRLHILKWGDKRAV